MVKRRGLWEKLRYFVPHLDIPWVTMGDFNVVKAVDERIGGRIHSNYDMQDFADCCSSIGVFDCPSSGEFYTWTNGWMKVMLDRALINQSCHNNNLMCHSAVNKMDCVSDHCPIIVDVFDRAREGHKGFKFFNMWIHHPTFKHIVDNTWAQFVYGTRQFVLTSNLKALKEPLKDLNKRDFSHIFKRAKQENVEFQMTLDQLDFLSAGSSDRYHLKRLWEKALFFQ